MDASGFFRGTSAEQDNRFSDKDKKLLKSMKFPPHFNTKVDMTKVNLPTFRKWIAKQVTQLLSFEDDVLIDYVYSLLESNVDPKTIQIRITGFLEKDTDAFMNSLWKLLVDAQDSIGGIPDEFLKDTEIMSAKALAEEDRVKEGIDRAQAKIGNISRVQQQQQQQQQPSTVYYTPSAIVGNTAATLQQPSQPYQPPQQPKQSFSSVVGDVTPVTSYGLNSKRKTGDEDEKSDEKKYRRFDVPPSQDDDTATKPKDEDNNDSEKRSTKYPSDRDRYRDDDRGDRRDRYRDDDRGDRSDRYSSRDNDRRYDDRDRRDYDDGRSRRDRSYDDRDRYRDDDRDRRDRYRDDDRGGDRYSSRDSDRDRRYDDRDRRDYEYERSRRDRSYRDGESSSSSSSRGGGSSSSSKYKDEKNSLDSYEKARKERDRYVEDKDRR